MVAARRAAGDYRHALRMLPASTPGWETPVLTLSARDGTGVPELWEAVEGHRAQLASTGQLDERRPRQQRRWLDRLLEETILRRYRSRPGFTEALTEVRDAVDAGRITVPQGVQELVDGNDAPALATGSAADPE